MRISKSVKIGDLVSLRGDKYIRCGKRMKPAGVYVKTIERTVRLLSGEVQRQHAEGGIQTWGECWVRAHRKSRRVRAA